VSYVAYHFHWPLNEILDLEHSLRRAFVAEIGRINERRSAGDSSQPDDETGW
jgi:hypothetical protein